MSVTWLHVSDFHLSDKGPYNQNVILNALFSSVRRLRGEGHAPDLIFATGDIAQNGKATEYAYATEFFNALLDAAGVTKKELFIVPGNHDVDRRMGKGLARTLESNDEADEYFDPEIPTPHLTQKFKAFSEWYNDYFEDIKAFPTNTTCSQVEVVSVNGCNVAILPLNSALFCIDDNDNNKLLIGRRCLGKTTEQLQCLVKADLNIALLHHPLDWLSLVERANIRAILGSTVDILLHGHYHETETEGIVLANGGYLKLAAGASYQTRQHPNSAMYATFDGNYVEIFPIHYVDKPQEIWTLDTGIFPTPPYTKRFLIPGIIFQNFIRIRGGLFIMGSPKNEVERGEDETEHEVQLSDFYLCRYAVTAASKSRSTATGIIKPAPTTKHTVRTGFCTSGILNYLFHLTFVIIFHTVPIVAPLPNITVHIKQSPSIWFKAIYGNSIFSKQPLSIIIERKVPIIVCLISRYINTGVKWCFVSCSASILPFRLSRQTKIFPCFYSIPLAVSISIIPTDMYDRMIVLTRFPFNT